MRVYSGFSIYLTYESNLKFVWNFNKLICFYFPWRKLESIKFPVFRANRSILALVNLLKFKRNLGENPYTKSKAFITATTYFQELKLSWYTVPYLEYPHHSVVCFPTAEEINWMESKKKKNKLIQFRLFLENNLNHYRIWVEQDKLVNPLSPG